MDEKTIKAVDIQLLNDVIAAFMDACREKMEKSGNAKGEKSREEGFLLTVATRFLTLGAATILSCLLISLGMQQFGRRGRSPILRAAE